MDRVNGADFVDIGGGRRGFRSQNKAAGINGTEVTAPWLNAIQENLLKVIEQAGLTPDITDWDLLWKALRVGATGRNDIPVNGWQSTPPGSPAEGDRYIVKVPGAGAWTGHDAELALYVGGGWVFSSPPAGLQVQYWDGRQIVLSYDGAGGWREDLATDSAAGRVELATEEETFAQQRDDRAVTPASLADYLRNIPVTTLYVRPDGNDANDGSSNDPAHAFATVQRAFDYASTSFFVGARQIEIVLGIAGTYARFSVTSGNFLVRGATGSADSYLVAGSPGPDSLIGARGGSLRLKDLRASRTDGSNHVLTASGGGSLTLDNVVSGITVSSAFAHVVAGTGGTISIDGPLKIATSAGSVLACAAGSMQVFGAITVPGAGAFSDNTVKASVGGTVDFGAGGSWIVEGGGDPLAQRYSAASNAVINTNGAGANFIPGTAAGVTETGGQYV